MYNEQVNCSPPAFRSPFIMSHPLPTRRRSLSVRPARVRPLAALATLAALFASPTPAVAVEPVILPLGAHFQEIIDAHPPGTHYRVSAGVHRGATMIPKDGDVISGEPGAVLNGCLTLDDWTFDGQWWVHDAPVVLPLGSAAGVECAEPLCTQAQDFYLDGVRFRPVVSLATLTTDRDWFLNRANNKVYLRADPSGRLAEMGGPSRTAIECAPLGRPWPLGVVIEDLVIDKYPCPPQVGAVRLAEGGVIRRCVVTRSHSYGVQLMLGASLVQDCYLADNAMCGIGGTGIGATIEGCEIAHNVWSLFAGLAWDNGGVKVAGTRDTTFRRNYIHHNKGPGLWWDIKTTLMLVEDNIVEFNDWEGILMEISEQAVIRRNICRWNGVFHRRNLWGAQICVQNGSSARIHHNYIETGPDFNSPYGSRQGIIVINQVDRAWDQGVFQGDFSTHDIDVYNNLLIMPNGGHSGVDYGTLGWNTYDDFLAADLYWRNNRYLAGRALDHRWSWRRPPDWDSTVAKWLLWEDWSTFQDVGSTFETFGPYDFPPTGSRQLPLIEETTGHDYLALKNALTRRPSPSDLDSDEDGLPDEWERRYFPSLTATDGAGDPDGDGLTNAQEWAAGTNPTKADTDNDGLPDGWEVANDYNPLVFDSYLDPDQDGRSTLEEYQDGTNHLVAESLDLPAPQDAISFWLTPSSRLTTETNGDLKQWLAASAHRMPVGWFGKPHVTGPAPTGVRLVDPGDMLLVPGAPNRWGSLESGFTFSFVYRPTSIDLSREWKALLTNEVYLNQGFRLRLEGGYLIMSSGQSGGSLSLVGHTRLTANTLHLITVSIAPNGRGGALYLDGHLEAVSTTGVVLPSPAALMLGNTNGVARQAGHFGDLVLFDRHLTHRERRSVEAFIVQKFITGVPASADRDRDGLPDEWEIANNLDPLTPDGFADDDNDGASNLVEFQRGLNPQVADTDGDGLPDGWEIRWGTDPLRPDANEDPDGDGLTNRDEYENGSDPQTPDIDPAFLAFNRMRLWWRADHGLESSEGTLTRWKNSMPAALDGQPLPETLNLPAAPTLWSGRTTLRLSENPMVSAAPVDPTTLLHPAGVTLTVAVRPANGPAASGFRPILSYGDLRVGVQGSHFAVRNATGSVAAVTTAVVPATPFILTCVATTPAEPARLFLNGLLAAEIHNLLAPAANPLVLGGANAYPGDVGEVILHRGVLPPLDRRFNELILLAKWTGTGRHAGDTDGDGLPDWWEHQACSDPLVPDAENDSDWNGETNLAAYQAGRPGFVWVDDDGDTMHDHWERLHGLDPLTADGDEDADQDGLSNALEHAMLTLPTTFDSTETWSIALADTEGPQPVTLHLRTSQRSWARRARWESTLTLQPGAWSWLPPGITVDTQPGALAIEDLVLSDRTPAAPNRALVRLGLLDE